MASIPHVPTVLIVDNDLAFVFWLGEIFEQLKWDTVPALSCRPVKLLGLSEADLIIVNPALNGVSDMLGTFNRARPPKIVFIGTDAAKRTRLHFDATLDRPEVGSEVSRAKWTKRIRQMLSKIAAA